MTSCLQCNERQGYIQQGNGSKNPRQMQIQVRDKCKCRGDVFLVQGVRSRSFPDILGRMLWWGNCMRVVLCCATILAKKCLHMSVPSRLLLWEVRILLWGVSSAPGWDVTARWNQGTWLIQSNGSFRGWQIIGCVKDFVMQSSAWDCAQGRNNVMSPVGVPATAAASHRVTCSH